MSNEAVAAYRQRVYSMPVVHARLNKRRRQYYIIKKYVRQDRLETAAIIRRILNED